MNQVLDHCSGLKKKKIPLRDKTVALRVGTDINNAIIARNNSHLLSVELFQGER